MATPTSPTPSFSTRAIVSGGRVSATSPSSPVAIPVPQNGAQPVVNLVKEGDLVRAIEITCACGEQIRLICDYE